MENLPAPISNAMKNQSIKTSDVNLVLPTETFGDLIGDYEKLTVEIVKINPDPREGEVFKMGNGKAFAKNAFFKIGNALGIIWDPERTGVIESTSRKSRAKAVGAIMKPNGKPIIMTNEKTVDIDVIEEEQRLKFEEEADKGKIVDWKTTGSGKKYPVFDKWESEEQKKRYVDLQVKKAVLQYKKFKDERALTGAMERVIKALVALKNVYTDKELEKPFALPHIVQDVDKMLNVPELRQFMIEHMVPNATKIFGNGVQQNNYNKQLQIESPVEAIIQDQQEDELTITAEDEIDTIADAGFEADPFFTEDDSEKQIDEIIAKEEKKKNIHFVYILRYLKTSAESRQQALKVLEGYYNLVEREKLIKILDLYCLTEIIQNYKTTHTKDQLKVPDYLAAEIKKADESRLRNLIKSCYELMLREGK